MEMLPTDRHNERPLKRVEYELLASEGHFQHERVELLFGRVFEMSPVDPAHPMSLYHLRQVLERAVGARAMVRYQDPFAASEISEPQPDVAVVPAGSYWTQHPQRAYLIIEVSRSSLDLDQGAKARLYAQAEVDEYWIVNLVDEVVEVYRDAQRGKWRSMTTYRRGETVAVLAFPDVTVAVADVLPPA